MAPKYNVLQFHPQKLIIYPNEQEGCEQAMEIGQRIITPRFLTVTIKEIFENRIMAAEAGYTEPTHYEDPEWEIVGKSLDIYHMEFAAFKKGPRN